MGSGVERQQNEIRKARQKMANMVTSGQVTALDRFGTPIMKGDLMVVELQPSPMMQVVDVRPQMDPRAPVDQVIIIVALTVPIAVRAGLPVSNMIIVGSTVKEDVVDLEKPVDPAVADPPAGPRLVLTDAPLEDNGADRPE